MKLQLAVLFVVALTAQVVNAAWHGFGPGELGGEDGEPDDDHEDARSREHQKEHAKQHHG